MSTDELILVLSRPCCWIRQVPGIRAPDAVAVRLALNLGPSILTRRHSARHFVDPALNSILESTLTPDDNDLFLSNVVGVPILVVHG
jgi:hypothetical protein